MMEFYERVARVCEASPLGRLSRRLQANRVSRQYPNVMSYEGVTGLEQYKWGDEKANPKQELVLPFIRMVAAQWTLRRER